MSLQTVWIRFGEVLQRLVNLFLRSLILAYKLILSPWMGGACRFQPSCSDYAIDALKIHDPITSIRLISNRISRCRPGGNFGIDLVPCKEQRCTHE